MSITCYTGLNGSGKTFEVVSSVILPALKQGRRVLTNIDGIDSELCRIYVHDKFDTPLEKIGHVVSVTTEQILDPNFFPYFDSFQTYIEKGPVQAGDLVIVDEAFKVWGGDQNIPQNHYIFFREHRHFVNENSGDACDLVLMTQSISDMNRKIKVVFEQTYYCKKLKTLGLYNHYLILTYDTYKQTEKNVTNRWNKKYDPEIFPLYKSYTSGKGKEQIVDPRQNIFNDKSLYIKALLMIIVLFISLYSVYYMYSSYTTKSPDDNNTLTAKDTSSKDHNNNYAAQQPNPTSLSEWRISGIIKIDSISFVVLTDGEGNTRLDQYSKYKGYGFDLQSTLDGKIVSRYSGKKIEKEAKSGGSLL